MRLIRSLALIDVYQRSIPFRHPAGDLDKETIVVGPVNPADRSPFEGEVGDGNDALLVHKALNRQCLAYGITRVAARSMEVRYGNPLLERDGHASLVPVFLRDRRLRQKRQSGIIHVCAPTPNNSGAY